MPRNAENDDRERALLEREQRRMRRVRLVSSRYRQRRAVTETKPLSPQDVFCTERRVADRFEQLERNKVRAGARKWAVRCGAGALTRGDRNRWQQNPRLYSGEPFSSRSSVHRVHLTGDILAPLSPRRTAPCLEREASRGTRELSERVQLYAVKAASSGTTEALSNAGAAGKRAVGEEDIARLSGIGQSGQAAQERPMQLLPKCVAAPCGVAGRYCAVGTLRAARCAQRLGPAGQFHSLTLCPHSQRVRDRARGTKQVIRAPAVGASLPPFVTAAGAPSVTPRPLLLSPERVPAPGRAVDERSPPRDVAGAPDSGRRPRAPPG